MTGAVVVVTGADVVVETLGKDDGDEITEVVVESLDEHAATIMSKAGNIAFGPRIPAIQVDWKPYLENGAEQ